MKMSIMINRLICLFRGHKYEKIIEGGIIQKGIMWFDSDWYKCARCGKIKEVEVL